MRRRELIRFWKDTSCWRGVRRCRGQVEAIERALDGEASCEQVMHLIAGAHGARWPV